MRLIRQRNHLDCGIAVAAMLADCSYQQALAADPEPEAQHGFWVGEMLDCLTHLTGRAWTASRRVTLPSKAAAAIIRPQGRRLGHWIAWDGIRIYDPEMACAFLPAEYPRKHWAIIRALS